MAVGPWEREGLLAVGSWVDGCGSMGERGVGGCGSLGERGVGGCGSLG